MKEYAVLSNTGDVVSFSYKNILIRYKGPYSLEYFTDVISYDNGYIVVMAKFRHGEEPIEDYIDMESIAEELYMDTAFLADIDEVRCLYA